MSRNVIDNRKKQHFNHFIHQTDYTKTASLNLIKQSVLGGFLGSGEEGDGPVVESFEGDVEPDSYWKKKEAFLRGSTVSLGEKFSSGTCNPASPLSISCLVAFLFFLTEKTSFHMSPSERVIFCMQKHFLSFIFMYEAHFPLR